MDTYEELQKPVNVIEYEGRCPLCETVMYESKSLTYKGKLYTFTFPLYQCISHYHGYFRWLGGKGHVRIRFPGILRSGKVLCATDKSDPAAEEIGIPLKCPDCGFGWEEVRMPHNTTWCPGCRREIIISEVVFAH